MKMKMKISCLFPLLFIIAIIDTGFVRLVDCALVRLEKHCFTEGEAITIRFIDIEGEGVFIGLYEKSAVPDLTQLPGLASDSLKDWVLTCGDLDNCDNWPTQGIVQLSTFGYSCNLLNLRHYLSDHAPVSIRSFPIDKMSGIIPSYISLSLAFAIHLRRQFACHKLVPTFSHDHHDSQVAAELPQSACDLALTFSAGGMHSITIVQECIRTAALLTKHDLHNITPILSTT